MLDEVAVPSWQVPPFKKAELRERRTKYCTLIPVLNEGERLMNQLRSMHKLSDLADIIIVDGGSTDGSVDINQLRDLGVRSLLIKQGAGKLSAQLRIGLAHALTEKYSGIILIDGNNKDNSEAIPQFIKALDMGFDHVQGSRFISGGKAINNPWWRLYSIKFLHAPLISHVAKFRYTDTTNGFRAYSASFLTDPRVQPFREIFSGYELHYYLAIIAGQLGMKIIEVPVERRYPLGTIPTKISFFKGNLKLLMLVLKMTFCFSRYCPAPESQKQ